MKSFKDIAIKAFRTVIKDGKLTRIQQEELWETLTKAGFDLGSFAECISEEKKKDVSTVIVNALTATELVKAALIEAAETLDRFVDSALVLAETLHGEPISVENDKVVSTVGMGVRFTSNHIGKMMTTLDRIKCTCSECKK